MSNVIHLEKEPVCSFCLKPKSEVVALVANPEHDKHICNECVAKFDKLIKDSK